MIDWGAKVLSPLIGVFGQPAILTQAGAAYPLSGVFDEAYVDSDVVDGMPITTTQPCFGLALTDLPVRPMQKSLLFVPAALGAPLVDTNYIVKKVQVDGHGWCRLLLNIAP